MINEDCLFNFDKIETQKDSLHHGHRKRLIERFKENGMDSFSDHEVLELLLFFAIPRKDTNEIGHILINHFGSLSAVFEANIDDLTKINGIGEHTAMLITIIAPACKKYLDNKYSVGFIIDNLAKAGEFMHKKFISETGEVVYAAATDNKRRVISCKPLHYGTVNATEVNIRKIIEFAVRANATGIIIAHNHPNGY
ncbi:MAG: JAB domain-containing protein, partial [Oscillospiraceae bacterium]